MHPASQGPAQSSAAAAPTLRPYQVEQVAGVQRELQRARSTMVVAATGTGKTVSLAELTRLTASGGLAALCGLAGKTLILVNRDELVRQTVRKCEDVGLSPDTEKASQRASTLAKVVIASVQTLRGKRLLRWARDHFALVIVDECHHAVAAGYMAILDHFVDAKVVGYTATPYRTDGKPLGEAFETVAHRYEIREAIAGKHLVPIIARRVVVDGVDLSSVKERAGDFAQDQLAAVMESERALRGQAVPLLELCGDRLSVAYGVDVAHAEALARTLNTLRPGVARAVSGRTDDDERAATLAAFQRGEFQILCNCDLLVEGWDCLDEETEILTADGWKRRGEIHVGDMVHSLNVETEALEMVPVTRVVERAMKPGERMFTLRSQHANIRTSEGHQFFLKNRATWERTDGTVLAQRRSAYSLPLGARPMAAPPGVPLSDDEIRFVAWFMTDGTLDPTRGLTISQAKEYRNEIRALLGRLGVDFTERVRVRDGRYPNARPIHEFRIPKGTHGGKLARAGWGRYRAFLEKDIAPALHEMSIAQFRVFWSELLKGDGAGRWLWCNSQAQVDAYTRMAIERGFSASYKSVVTKHGTTVFRVSVRDKQWLTSNPRDKRAAKAGLEAPREGEVVWCVTNRNSTLVTRRAGKIVIIGNCPEVACVAICRPTKSLIRFVQCAGRGLRPAPHIGKRDCLVLTFGDGKTPGLIGPADCLAGRVLDDDLRDEIDRLIGHAQLEIEPVIEQAESELAKRRDAMRLHAVVKWHAEQVDPFIGEAEQESLPKCDHAWHRDPASPAQLKALEADGVTISKLPPGLSRADAWNLLARIRARPKRGLCSYRAARKLSQAGVIDTKTLKHERAKVLLDKLRLGGWRPSAIASEPETMPAYATAERRGVA